MKPEQLCRLTMPQLRVLIRAHADDDDDVSDELAGAAELSDAKAREQLAHSLAELLKEMDRFSRPGLVEELLLAAAPAAASNP